MAVIPQQYLDRLRGAGLLVSKPFVPGHVAFPDGVTVCKPASVAGYALPDFESWWGRTDVKLDAPCLWLHSDAGKWFVTSRDYVPGPGPGDFVDTWGTAEEAVADILDFYFGKADRMDVKRREVARGSRPHRMEAPRPAG